MKDSYEFLGDKMFDGKVYGIASMGNAMGIVYNKSVFEKAGISELPTTPDAFLDDLKQIKDKTDAIPLYTNYAAGWTLTAWDSYIGGTATGDADYMNNTIVHQANPFSKRSDETGPYAVYNTLYEAVSEGLTEDDPTTTDWEGCKSQINNGKIGCMVLGSWAIIQMQEAGEQHDKHQNKNTLGQSCGAGILQQLHNTVNDIRHDEDIHHVDRRHCAELIKRTEKRTYHGPP